MTLLELIPKIQEGSKIRRQSWLPNQFMLVHVPQVADDGPAGIFYNGQERPGLYFLIPKNLLGDDWVIL
jgi:hypothetical protein